MAFASVGTRIQINTNTIVELTEINGMSLTADTIDVTNLSSPGGFREFILGMKDSGEVSISGWFNPQDTNGQIAIYNAYLTSVISSFSILFSSSIASWTFNGVITNFETSVSMEDAVTFSATIKVSGQPTLGLTASAGLSALSLTGTGGTLTPAFSANNRTYSFSGVTATSATVTATAASHTIQLFVDGTLFQTLTSGSASNAIALSAIGGRRLTIVAFEANKTQVVYDIALVKTA